MLLCKVPYGRDDRPRYADCKNQKKVLLADLSTDSREDSRYEKLFASRKLFFENCKELLDPYYLEGILDLLPVALENDQESLAYYTKWIQEVFSSFSDNLNLYNTYFKDMNQIYNNAFCIVGHTASASTDLGTKQLRKHWNSRQCLQHNNDKILYYTPSMVDWNCGFRDFTSFYNNYYRKQKSRSIQHSKHSFYYCDFIARNSSNAPI